MLSEVENRAIGDRIQNRRKDLGFSQESFGEAVGLSRAAVGKLERGEAAPKMDTLLSICRVLKMTPNMLLDYSTSDIEDVFDTELLILLQRAQKYTPERRAEFIKTVKIVAMGIEHLDQ